MSANTRYKTNSSAHEEEEMLRNVTTTNEYQAPNKFASNIKKVLGKPRPDVKTYIAKISYGRGEVNESNTTNILKKDSNTKNFPPHKKQKEISNNIESSRSSQLLEDFAKKKEERDREIKEIQEILKKMKSPEKYGQQSVPDSSKDEKEDDSPKDVEVIKSTDNVEQEKDGFKNEVKKIPFSVRSTTEVQLNIKLGESANVRVARRDSTRSCSAAAVTNKPRSKSSQLPLSAKEMQTSRKMGYNPEEARRYMEMQRKQRKVKLTTDPSNKAKIEKEEIKKRLEELKKNTRKLMSKNTHKKELMVKGNTELENKISTTPKRQEQKQTKEPTRNTKQMSLEMQGLRVRGTVSSRKSITDRSTVDSNRKESSVRQVSDRTSQSLNDVLKTSALPLIENHKRIGLLRKEENDKDFSYTSHQNYNFDKENQNLETLAKQLLNSQENIKTNRDKNNTESKQLEEQLPQVTKIDKETQACLMDVVEDKKTKDSKLEDKEAQVCVGEIAEDKQIADTKVPDNEKTKTRPGDSEDKQMSDLKTLENNSATAKIEENKANSESTELVQNEITKVHQLPFWLRPSPAQVYPYNFIMAVRRKLEAIAQPIATQADENKQSQATSTTGLVNQPKQKKRKSELLEVKQNKKIKGSQEKQADTNIKKIHVEENHKELNSNKEISIKQLQPSPNYIQINEYESRENDSYQGESKKNAQNLERERKSTSLLKYKQKATENVENHDIKDIKQNHRYLQIQDIPVFKTSQKSLQSVNLDQGDYKQSFEQGKLTSDYKSMESLNSEINSNLSSISLQMPISNTLTEVSSLPTESRKTYARSIKQNSLQSEDEVTSLTSQNYSSSEKDFVKANKRDFEFVKPRPVSPLSLDKVDKLKIERKESSKQSEDNDKDMVFTQLLEDFNRSLSQVIHVNEQLKSSLDKSQQILSPHSSKKFSETDIHYSSDFEKSTSVDNSSKEKDQFKDSSPKNSEHLKQRKLQLFQTSEEVEPLLSSQRISEEDNQHKMTFTHKEQEQPQQHQQFLDLNFNLNLKSLTISTATSEEENQKATPLPGLDDDESSCSITTQSYEKRLYDIEKLRKTLKQTILESKEKRKEKGQKEKEGKEKQETSNFETKFFKKNSQKESNQILSDEIEKQSGAVNENYSSEISSVTQSQSENNLIKHKQISKNSLHKYEIIEKYKKPYKTFFKENAGENVKTSDSESSSQSQAINTNKAHSLNSSNETSKSKTTKAHNHSHTSALEKKSQEMIDYSTINKNSNTNKVSTHPQNITTTHKNKENYNETESQPCSSTKSEVNKPTLTNEVKRSKSTLNTKEPDDAVSSSVVEELQKTYESDLYDNGNTPQHLTAQFIESHVNCSRGDFQTNLSESHKFNEKQFQQLIESADLHVSSTEFAQSADDEITSSVASKPPHKTVPKRPSFMNVASGKMLSKPLLSTTSPSKSSRHASIGSEIVKFFSQYDTEKTEENLSITESVSESSLNYSNVGLYEKLIQNETNKSQHLTALLKMREKALLDRTKGQIAWLEVQKARYKSKGLMSHIVAIKKKQRGILLKMEKEREEIKRLLYTATTNSEAAPASTLKSASLKTHSLHNTPTKHKKERLPSSAPPLTKPKALGQQLVVKADKVLSASSILRATYNLESSQAVEELLRKREDDLRKRREHVERLIQWHQRLDEEEAEVLNLERQLLHYNNVPHLVETQQSKLPTATNSATTEKLTPALTATSSTPRKQTDVPKIKTPGNKRASSARKMEKRLKEIDRSLRELSQISASSTAFSVAGQEDSVSSIATNEVEFVRTTGFKLNKLWKRLTSQQIEKFEPSRRYKLCKTDLERLYEEAKMAVLKDFAEDEDRIAKELLEKSASNFSTTTSPTVQVELPAKTDDNKIVEVPMLNLNFSSGPSEAEEESANNSQSNTTQQGNYSPSVAEQNFKAQVEVTASVPLETISEQETPNEAMQSSRMENNVQMFLALSQRIQASGRQSIGRQIQGGSEGVTLQRSLSDTDIFDVQKFKADKTTHSQNNIETRTSHSNTSITTNSSARSFNVSEQHQRSKSSIVEITYIPSTQTETQANNTDISQTIASHHTNNHQEHKHNETRKDFEQSNQLSNQYPISRISVIHSVGTVSPINISQSQPTSSDIETIAEDSKSLESLTKVSTVPQNLKQKSTYSGQIGTDSETKAKEISSKLEEISAAVLQLSQMNALPSYESVTNSLSKHKSKDEHSVNTNNDSNSSTDASSYSFNFDNITTDKHSSPGVSSSLDAYSLQNKTTSSKTYLKVNECEENETKESSSTTPLNTSAGDSNSISSSTSKTFVKDGGQTTSQTLTQSMLENGILDLYEADFESDLSNVTHIEDITIPAFETTTETTHDDGDDVELSTEFTSKAEDAMVDDVKNLNSNFFNKTYDAEELRNSLPTSSSEKIRKTDFKSYIQSPDRESLLPPPPLPPPPPPPSAKTSSTRSGVSIVTATTTATTTNQNGNNHLMPDIINELELRRHQLILDNEQLKQYEHVTAVPYMYVREIPNKPPPPYVPPAHGSPMTTIFPSEDRIKDITFRRTHELYCELLKTEYCNERGEKLASVMDEQITNIYERIILDICREYLEEHKEILRDGDPANFHSQLAFFNPPNRLRCIQDAIYKEVRSCLAMDKIQPKRTQIYSVYGQRAKQDHIGKIIIQEMYDEDDRWCNFHREESEVLHLIVEEMTNKNIAEIAKEVLLEEGGTIEQDEMVVEEEDATEANHLIEKTYQSQECRDKQEQTNLQTSSVLMETINEDDILHCVSDSKQECTVLNQTTRIVSDSQESVNVNNTSLARTTVNSIETCT